MNKLRIITSLNYTKLEERINEIGDTFKILGVSLSEADNGRLKVAAVLLEENIAIVSNNSSAPKTIEASLNNIRIYKEFDGLRLVVAIEGKDFVAGNGGGIFDLIVAIKDIQTQYHNETGNYISFGGIDFNKVYTQHVPHISR